MEIWAEVKTLRASAQREDVLWVVSDGLEKEESGLTGEDQPAMLLGRCCVSKEGLWICYEQEC